MKPGDLLFDIVTHDPEYRDRIQARDVQSRLDRAYEAKTLGDPILPDAPAVDQVRAETQKARAQAITHRMDVGMKAGPDETFGRLQNFEETGDPSGATVVGLTPRERADRVRTIGRDERVLDFFERHPDAAVAAADDARLLNRGAKLLSFLSGPAKVALQGRERALLDQKIFGLEVSIVDESLREQTPERVASQAALLGEQKRLMAERDKIPHAGDGVFSALSPSTWDLEEFVEVAGNLVGQVESGLRGGVRQARNVMPIAFAGGAAVGGTAGGIATAPVAGAGAVPGALALGTTSAIGAGILAFDYGFTETMIRPAIGQKLAEYRAAGRDMKDPAVLAAAVAYGASVGAIERVSTGIEWGLVGKKFVALGASRLPAPVRTALGERALNWATNPSTTARLRQLFGSIAAASGVESVEEFFQGTFSEALATVVEGIGTSTPVEEVFDQVLDGLAQDIPAALDEAVLAFGGTMLVGGLASPVGVYRANRASAREQEEVDFFDALAEEVGASKLMERSPRLAGEFASIITAGTPSDTVYIDPAAFADALNSEGISAAEANTVIPGITQKIAEAKNEGRLVSVPTREFVTNIVNTNLFPKLRAHITRDPTRLTNAQRVEAQKLVDQSTDETVATKDDLIALERKLDESAVKVGEQIREALLKTGTRSESAAAADAQIVTARVRSLAARVSSKSGRLFTPEEVFDLYPLNVLDREQAATFTRTRGRNVEAGLPGVPTEAPRVSEIPEIREAAADTTVPLAVGEAGAARAELPASALPSAPATAAPAEPVAVEPEPDVLGQPAKPKREPKDRIEELSTSVPGLAKAAAWLSPEERVRIRKDTAADFVAAFEGMPPTDEISAAALAGFAKRGWYARSAQAIVDIFGITDAPRFTALLASFSPRTSVESNTINALTVWANWVKAGRPTDEDQLLEIFAKSVQGKKGAKSVLGAWIPNALLSLTTEDPESVELSGEKVDSFMQNLRGHVNRVTNDAWEALLLGLPDDTQLGLVPTYFGASAAIRQAAAFLTKVTGIQWTPAEVQETTWSWAKALAEKAKRAGEKRSITQIVKEEALTDEEIADTPDFAMLFADGVYRRLIEEAGLDPDAAASARRSDGRDDGGATREDLGVPRDRFQAALVRAARRIERTQAERRVIKRDRKVEQARRKTVEFVRLLRSDRVGAQSGGRAYTRGSRGGSLGDGLWTASEDALKILKLWRGDSKVAFREADAQTYLSAIQAAAADHPFGASVEVKSLDDYAQTGAQLFLSEDGLSGIMVKPDGDIVSAFSHPRAPKGRADAMMLLAIQQGGWKLDAFDTILPHLYSRYAAVAVSRVPFNDTFKPKGWTFKRFKKFNNGRPDVVLMVIDPDRAHPYQVGDGARFEDFDEAATQQVEPSESVEVLDSPANEARKQIIQSAIEQQGLTDDLGAAGFILPNGKLLQFKDPSFQDHLDISFDGMSENRGENLDTFLKAGAIRVKAAYGNIHIATMPTTAQTRVLKQISDMSDGLSVDFGGVDPYESMFIEPTDRPILTIRQHFRARANESDLNSEALQLPFPGIGDAEADAETLRLREFFGGDLDAARRHARRRNLNPQVMEDAIASAIDVVTYTSRELMTDALISLQGSRWNIRRFLSGEREKLQAFSAADVHDTISGNLLVEILVGRAHARALLKALSDPDNFTMYDEPLYRGVVPEHSVSRGSDIAVTTDVVDLGTVAGFTPFEGKAQEFGNVVYRLKPEKPIPVFDVSRITGLFSNEQEKIVVGPFRVRNSLFDERTERATVDIRLHEEATGILNQARSLADEFGLNSDPFESATIGGEGPRAQIALKEREAFVALLEANDMSTFQHELAHWFLQQAVVFRQLGLADEQMVADLETVVRYTGAQSWQHLTRPLADTFQGKADKPHEIFARGFEAYLAEGRAPTPELDGVFLRFRGWIRTVYGSLAEARRRVGRPLSDEIRSVYDRLFLIDQAVEEAGGDETGPLIEERPPEWSDAQWARYQNLWVKQKQRAFAHVARKHLPAARRQMREQKAEALALFRSEGEAQVAADPGWSAIAWLKRDPDALGLDREGLAAVLGRESAGLIEALLARPDQGTGRRLVAPEGQVGLDPEWVAESFGLRSAGELVEAILQARTVDQIVQERINREIEGQDQWSEQAVEEDAIEAASQDREALALVELAYLRGAIARGPGLETARRAQAATGAPTAPEAQAQLDAADEALSVAVADDLDGQAIADLQARRLAAESSALAGAQGRAEAGVATRALRAIEARLTSGSLRRKARLLAHDVQVQHLKREQRAWGATAIQAGKQARKLIAQRKFAEAAVQIERQLLAHYSVLELTKFREEHDRAWRLIARLRKPKTLEKLRAPGFDGAAQIVALMGRFDLRRARPGRQDRPTRLGTKLMRAIEAQIREGTIESLADFSTRLATERAQVLTIPAWVTAPGAPPHWTELAIIDFLGLADTLRQIEHVSRDEVKNIRTERAVSVEQAKNEIVSRLDAVNAPAFKREKLRPNPLSVQNLREMAVFADAMILRIGDWIDFAGGDDIDANSLRKYLLDPIVDGQLDYLDKMATLLVPWTNAIAKLDRRRMASSVVVPELGVNGGISTLRYSEIFMMGLHRGTESNLFRLYEGFQNSTVHQWTKQGIDAAIQLLTDEEEAVIQEIWNAFEGMWPLIEKHHFELTGEHAPKLELREFISHTGRVMKGGYMPAKYDPRFSALALALDEKANVQGLFGHSFVKTQVEHGFTKSRAQNYSAPLNLNVNVIARHLDEVMYDLAMRKAVSDVYKLVNHPEVREAIRKTWGPEYHEALKMMVHDAGRVQRAKAQGLFGTAESISDWARSSVVYSGLGYRLSTGLLQLTGWLPILGEVGPTWTLAATARFAARGGWSFVRRAREHSAVLRNRASLKDRELAEFVRNLDGKHPARAKVDQNMGLFITIGDSIVSAIAWDAQRMKSLHKHGNMKRAMREADRAISRTQGSSTIGEVSALMRAQGFGRWLTLFGSYFSNVYARARRVGRLATGLQATEDVGGKPVRKVRPVAAAWLALTTIYLTATIDAYFRGEAPDDDEDESFVAWSMARAVSLVGQAVPGARELIDYFLFPDKRFLQQRSNLSRFLEVPGKIVEETSKAFDEDEEFDAERTTRAVMLGLTMGKAAPLSQAEIWVDNFWDDLRVEHPQDLIWRKPIERRE